MSHAAEPFLDGRSALVTGAGSGIGRATALALARAGAAAVVLVGRRREPLEEAAELVGDCTGGRGLPVAGDVALEDLVALAVARAAEAAPLAAVVHAAGEVRPKPLAATTAEDFRTQLEVHQTASFLLAREALPHLATTGGGLVLVASISGVRGPAKFPGFAAYASSKAGQVALAEALAPEYAASGARINAISPGSVATEMLARAAPGAEPAMTPEEVADAIAFLLSPASRPMNGRNLELW